MQNVCFKTFILILAALMFNILTALLAIELHLVLFLDTIFTVAITFYAGLIPGIIVAFIYNPVMTIVLCLKNGHSFFIYDSLYCFCGMVIVLITWAFSRNKSNFQQNKSVTIFYLIIISFSSAIASCLLASCLDTFIRPFFGPASGFGPTDTFTNSFADLDIGDFLSYFLPRIPLTFLDRLISTFAGFFVYSLLAKKKLPAKTES